MTLEDQAWDFVRRTDAALADLDQAEEIWASTRRSGTQEMRLHTLPVDLDKAIRKVGGSFETWTGLDPSEVAVVRDNGPINLLWVVSSHPSGRVREAFVHEARDLPDDRVLPHLANRALDFVPVIRELAAGMVTERLAAVLAERTEQTNQDALPTPVHIAVSKLLVPRTAMLSPELITTCIGLTKTATMSRPRRLRGYGLNKMLERCQQTFEAATEPTSRDALTELMSYFNEAPS